MLKLMLLLLLLLTLWPHQCQHLQMMNDDDVLQFEHKTFNDNETSSPWKMFTFTFACECVLVRAKARVSSMFAMRCGMEKKTIQQYTRQYRQTNSRYEKWKNECDVVTKVHEVHPVFYALFSFPSFCVNAIAVLRCICVVPVHGSVYVFLCMHESVY